MRAWIAGDKRLLKTLISRNFRMLFGSKPAVILDAKSWIEAAGTQYRCKAYRFGDVYVRDSGPVAVFATQLDLKATMNRDDWSGEMWLTDIWRKSRVRRRWQLIERVLSRPDERAEVAPAVRSLQLWR